MGTSRDFTPEAIMSTYTIESMSDTIAAQATAPGEAAIAIVRRSGAKVRDVIASLTQSSKERESHRAFVAQLHDDEVHLKKHWYYQCSRRAPIRARIRLSFMCMVQGQQSLG